MPSLTDAALAVEDAAYREMRHEPLNSLCFLLSRPVEVANYNGKAGTIVGTRVDDCWRIDANRDTGHTTVHAANWITGRRESTSVMELYDQQSMTEGFVQFTFCIRQVMSDG